MITKSPFFLNLALQAFPAQTTVSTGIPDFGASCRGWLHDGSLDDLCIPTVLNWLTQSSDFSATYLALLQVQNPAPTDKDFQIQRATEIQKVTGTLVQAIPQLKDKPDSKDGYFVINVVLLNSGDGDDVLYPDATLSCDLCGSDKITLVSSTQYQTIKAHSFLQARYEPNYERLNNDQSNRLKDLVKASAVLKIRLCPHFASKNDTCDDGEVR
jgi:hypothetical protein